MSIDRAQNEAERLAAELELAQQAEARTKQFEKGKADWRNKIAEAQDARKQFSVDDLLSGKVPQRNESKNQQLGKSLFQEQDNENEEIQIQDETVEQAEAEAAVAEDPVVDGNIRVTKVINGNKVTRTIDEWTNIASKVEDADAYYKESVRRMYEQKNQKPIENEKEVLKELAKNLQFGDEEQAAAAVDQLMNRAAQKANERVEADSLQKAGEAVYLNFAKEYSDVVNDQILNSALQQLELKAINEGKRYHADELKNFDMRLRDIGNQVRNWRDNMADNSVKKEKKQDLINKKQQISNLNTASQKQTLKQEKPVSESEGRNAAVQAMFQSRRKSSY